MRSVLRLGKLACRSPPARINDNTGVGLVAGRRAFYVEGQALCLWRFLRLFGRYLEIRAEVIGCELEVRVYYHRSVCVADAAKAQLPHFIWRAPPASLPLQWCQAKPPGWASARFYVHPAVGGRRKGGLAVVRRASALPGAHPCRPICLPVMRRIRAGHFQWLLLGFPLVL